jgi:type IV secretory pathway component VirB8
MCVNETKIDLVQILMAKKPPYVFELTIKMSNIQSFDIKILEKAISDLYKLNEDAHNSCPSIVTIEGQEYTKEQIDTLYRWDSLKLLRDALRKEILEKDV